ncbi:MAG: hypothetical protein R3F33_13880 [Planctomycetota bacterium]
MKTLKTLLALVAITFAAPAAQAQVPSLDARISLNVVEQSLAQVVQYIRDRSGANIVLIEGGDKVVNDLQITDVDWRDALEYATRMAGCVVTEDKSGVLTVTDPVRVHFDFTDADINEIITTIATSSGANIIVGPEVTGTLRVRLQNVPWRDALEEVCRTRGYVVVENRSGILRVVDPSTLEKQKETRSYQLRYIRPRGVYVPVIRSEFVDGGEKAPTGPPSEHFTVLEALKKSLSGDGQLDYMDAQNVIIVHDTQQVHESIQDILRRLDVEPTQVFIDVKFVSTSDTDILNLGVNYGDGGPQISASGGQIPIELPFTIGQGGFEDGFIADQAGFGPFADSTGSSSGVIIPDTIFGSLSFTQVQATLRMLQRNVSSDVVQAPTIVTMDGRPATIFVGETVRYAEAKSEQGQAGGLSLSVQEAGASPVEVGFQLMVRPSVVPGTKKVMLDVIPKETSLAGSSTNTALAPAGFDVFTVGAQGTEGTIALPRTRSSTLMTQMMLESGQTGMVGGLTTDTESETETRVPYLSRIPVVGELFKHRSKTKDKRSLLIFLTPTLVHSAEDTEYILQQELMRRRGSLREEIEQLLDPSLTGDK